MELDKLKMQELHIYDKSNPHDTTWNQVGAAPLVHEHGYKDLPIATNLSRGLVSIGNNINVNDDGHISVDCIASKTTHGFVQIGNNINVNSGVISIEKTDDYNINDSYIYTTARALNSSHKFLNNKIDDIIAFNLVL